MRALATDGHLQGGVTLMEKEFFDRVVTATGNGDLAPYAKAWKGSTIFTLKQLAGNLYPYELRRALKVATIWSHGVFGFLFLIVVSPCYWLASPLDALGMTLFMFGFALIACLIFGDLGEDEEHRRIPNSSWACRVARWLCERSMRSGVPGSYTTELTRFAETVAMVIEELDITLEKLNHSEEEVRTAVDERLFELASCVSLTEKIEAFTRGDANSPTEEIASARQQLDLARHRLRNAYDAFSAIGLANGGYGRYFKKSQKRSAS